MGFDNRLHNVTFRFITGDTVLSSPSSTCGECVCIKCLLNPALNGGKYFPQSAA